MDKQEIRDIAETVVDELIDLEDGSVITISNVMDSIGCESPEITAEEMAEIDRLARSIAKNKGVAIESAGESPSGFWPWHENLLIRNKNAQVRCPHCGSRNTGRYMYGMPAYSSELQRRLDSGKLILGGCCLRGVEVNGQMVMTMPGRRCNKCKKDFGTPPLIVSKDGMTAEDYMDIILSVKLSVSGSMGSDGLDAEIRKADDGADVSIRRGYESKAGQISDDRWYELLDKLLYEYYLFDWKKSYNDDSDESVMDGISWKLELGLTGGRHRTWKRDGVLPPYGDDVISEFLSVYDSESLETVPDDEDI